MTTVTKRAIQELLDEINAKLPVLRESLDRLAIKCRAAYGNYDAVMSRRASLQKDVNGPCKLSDAARDMVQKRLEQVEQIGARLKRHLDRLDEQYRAAYRSYDELLEERQTLLFDLSGNN